jgi:DNA invertase Pin-like site-specific DNA recombinase
VSAPAKIGATHLQRVAIVYVRQSSMMQVRCHTESTARQYALVDEAVRLGWPPSRVEVIDDDLGLSGRSADHRGGFRDLVGRVCVGEVGAILGLEISRLARSSADLSRLLELARLTDTLVIDSDGVYDLSDFNDRLLLGLKGTMSEAELHLLAGRLQGAKRAAAARGDLRVPLPVGYLYDDAGGTIIDPDEEVRAAVADVFAAFTASGSAYGVVAAFAGRRFPRRAYGGAWAGRLRWGRLTHSRVLGILANPAYAGAYVFGRRRCRQRVTPDGRVHSTVSELPREQWEVVIQDHHPGYISWQQFVANEARLAANRTNAGARPAREGTALCQGIVLCGGCGRPMGTRYQDGRGIYECGSRADGLATPACRSVTAACVDAAVAARLLEALGPTEIALALAAADEVADRRARATRAAELAVERAVYEAARAERAFAACEPENRLVARSLEARWEAKLHALAEAEAALAASHADVAPLPSRAELEALAADLPGLWAAASTSDKDRKRLLRTLVADVTITSEPDGDKLHVGVRWRSGASEELLTVRPARAHITRRTPVDALELVRRLGPQLGDDELAAELNTAGHATGAGLPFDRAAVRWVRGRYQIPAPPPPPADNPAAGELTVTDVGARLGITASAVYYWIHHGQLHARRSPAGRWFVPFPTNVEADCRDRIADSGRIHPVEGIDPKPLGGDERSVDWIAAHLGISTHVVYYWLKRGYLSARSGPGGRKCVHFPPAVELECRQRIADSTRINPSSDPQTQHAAARGAV